MIVQRKFATDLRAGRAAYWSQCTEQLRHCLVEGGIAAQRCSGIGVTVPGAVEPGSGVLRYAPYLGLEQVDVERELSACWHGLPVWVANDVNACALAEMRFGKARAQSSFIWITISTGIGGAVVLNGDLWHGVDGSAGELGHVVVQWEDGQRCGCGNDGCLEAEASGKAIERAIAAALKRDGQADQVLARFAAEHPAPLSAELSAAAAEAGSVLATEVFRNAGRYIGRGLSCAVNLFNPAAVYVGGGVSRSFHLLQQGIAETLCSAVIGEGNRNVPIELSGLGYEAGLIGAASLVFEHS